MTGNYLPWIAAACILLVSLIWKGYVKNPFLKAAPTAPHQAVVSYATDTPSRQAPVNLEGLDSHYLGLAFARAKRREAEDGIAYEMAKQAGDLITAAFTAPFAKPAPAGPTPPAAAPNP